MCFFQNKSFCFTTWNLTKSDACSWYREWDFSEPWAILLWTCHGFVRLEQRTRKDWRRKKSCEKMHGNKNQANRMQTSTLACIHKHLIYYGYINPMNNVSSSHTSTYVFLWWWLGKLRIFPNFIFFANPEIRSPTWSKVPGETFTSWGWYSIPLFTTLFFYIPGGDHQISEPSTHHHHAWPILAHVFLLCYAASWGEPQVVTGDLVLPHSIGNLPSEPRKHWKTLSEWQWWVNS